MPVSARLALGGRDGRRTSTLRPASRSGPEPCSILAVISTNSSTTQLLISSTHKLPPPDKHTCRSPPIVAMR